MSTNRSVAVLVADLVGAHVDREVLEGRALSDQEIDIESRASADGRQQ